MKILSNWLRSYLPELAVSDRQLADDLTLRGIAVEGVFDFEADGSLFEMDITTNRVDAMNHYGIAREAATIYGLQLKPLETALPAAKPTSQPFPVTIEEQKLCGRFTARVLRDVTIAPSTGIVADRFRLLEQKLISNAVDATNFVTLAIGQPTHAFDLDKLEGGIVVRRARKGEKLKTLDGIERTLDPDDLIVADHKKALGIAGVIGGWDTMITPETKNILVEAAWFDPATVRRSSKRHLIHTDASHRFERGADFNAASVANALVSRIILEAGGYAEGDLVDVLIPEAEQRTAKRASIHFAVSEARRILGPTEDKEGITAAISETILTGLGCTLHKTEEEHYSVTLPSWRLDLEREIDLIEEIARVYGYNRFQNTLPSFSGSVVALPWAEKEAALREALLALCWNEAISSTFCSVTDADTFSRDPKSAVAIGNPLSEEAGMLRPSLVPGMLGMLSLNISRDVESAALFEMGTVFTGAAEKVDERPSLAIGATGAALGAAETDFFDIKGTVETLLGKFSSRSLYYDRFPSATGLMPAWLHPGRSARAVLDGATVGYFGQLHPAEAERRKLKQTVFLGELYLDRLYKQSLRQPAMRELSRFQPVRRDFSLIVPDTVTYSVIADAVASLTISELQSFALKEILRDPKGKLAPVGHYSLLLGTVFQSLERTLREEEVQSWSQQVVAALEARGARLRS
ncbi:phenylalanine--tRNA ligase subunit beta [Paracidobacterium acidisoli]|uniref:Phenylalanine--tRNA ligase beta subunit n=1 Tax=Paracidobacterium acidisoli TaxID=2303751 RepID=A0A372IPL0_9BACT|nr:phenylalanine--tRNA ligase subunit beta [Paracidobacterium acidisoli]MBT9331117.1 phenylalanine--tRNA ligase subunit beta [Paracidobacterium acidisoli]